MAGGGGLYFITKFFFSKKPNIPKYAQDWVVTWAKPNSVTTLLSPPPLFVVVVVVMVVVLVLMIVVVVVGVEGVVGQKRANTTIFNTITTTTNTTNTTTKNTNK